MKYQDFVNLSITEIERLSGIDRCQLSRIMHGRTTSERTINKLAETLALAPHDVLRGINQRRRAACEICKSEIAS